MEAALPLLRKEPIRKRVPQGPCGSGRERQSSGVDATMAYPSAVAWGAASWSQPAGTHPLEVLVETMGKLLPGACKACWVLQRSCPPGAGGTLKPPAGDANRTRWEATLWGTGGPSWETVGGGAGWGGMQLIRWEVSFWNFLRLL